MGQLISQTIPSFFQGVSRQPDNVRNPGQVEDADNVWLSVVTGGFSTRPGTELVAQLQSLPDANYSVHFYARDNNEQYIVFVGSGWIKVFDLAGNEYTVNSPDGLSYLNSSSPKDGFAFATILDYTFIVNRSTVPQMDTRTAPTRTPEALVSFAATFGVTEWGVVLDGTTFAVSNTSANWYPNNVATQLKNKIDTAAPGVYNVVRSSGLLHITRVDGADFTFSYYDGNDNSSAVAFKDTWSTPTNLPLRAPDGYVVKIVNDRESPADAYWLKYSEADAGWIETVAPGAKLGFDATTMPHVLVRETDGTFTFKKAPWTDRVTGDDTTAPEPDFVGYPIRDLVYIRSRLGFLSDESIYFSQTNGVFTFWPQSLMTVTDDDPFGRTGPEKNVNKLQYGEVFNKSLFLTSPRTQFEVTSDTIFSPKQTKIEATTHYATEEACRPYSHGNQLYFAARAGSHAAVFEYFFEQDTWSNTAVDITKHVEGYLPAPIVQITGDTVTDSLFVRSPADPTSLYVYKMFWNGDTKAQSAWSRWKFNGEVQQMFVYDSHLWLLIGYAGAGGQAMPEVRLEKLPLDLTEASSTFPTPVRLDCRIELTGVYDPVSATTSWTLPFDSLGKIAGVVSTDFTAGAGQELVLTYDPAAPSVVSAKGDWSAGRTIFGFPVEMFIQLSKIFVREGDPPRARTVGRLQLKHIQFSYVDSGPFEVSVVPYARSASTYLMSAARINDVSSQIGLVSLADTGEFKVRIHSRADATTVQIRSLTHNPVTITGATWVGFFHSISK